MKELLQRLAYFLGCGLCLSPERLAISVVEGRIHYSDCSNSVLIGFTLLHFWARTQNLVLNIDFVPFVLIEGTSFYR